MLDDRDIVRAHAARIRELVAVLEDVPDDGARAVVHELVHQMMRLHALGLERMLTICSENDAVDGVVDQLLADAYVEALLVVHELHPVPLDDRLRGSLNVAALAR